MRTVVASFEGREYTATVCDRNQTVVVGCDGTLVGGGVMDGDRILTYPDTPPQIAQLLERELAGVMVDASGASGASGDVVEQKHAEQMMFCMRECAEALRLSVEMMRAFPNAERKALDALKLIEEAAEMLGEKID